MKTQMRMAIDAFADGQIESKLWLCRELEAVVASSPQENKLLDIWVLAGWYGLLPFLLFSRERLQIASITMFDVDPEAVKNAEVINKNWLRTGKFRAVWADVNLPLRQSLPKPDVVINTSCEHFDAGSWWSLVPSQTLVALQSTDMVHAEHISRTQSPAELQARFAPWTQVDFSGELLFKYDTGSFTRHMLIGKKA